MKVKFTVSLAIAATIFSSPAFAEGSKKKRIKRKPEDKEMPAKKPSYGMAGCGLGTLIIKEDSMPMQILALTTNASSASQTFGITTGTSGCDGEGPGVASLRLEEQKLFVTNNYSLLSIEAARGQGEMLNSLATLAGCSPSSYETFAAFTQGQFEKIFVSRSPGDAVLQMNSLLGKDDKLSKDCKPLNVEGQYS